MLRQENERPLAALRTAGVEPQDVQYILLTPLVSYANANVALFSEVKKIFISRRGWIEEFFAPEIPGFVPRNILMPDDVVTYLTTKVFDRVHLVGEEEEVLPGIRMSWVWRSPSIVDGDFDPNKQGACCYFRLLLQIRKH